MAKPSSSNLAVRTATDTELQLAEHWPVQQGVRCQECGNQLRAEDNGKGRWCCTECGLVTFQPSALAKAA